VAADKQQKPSEMGWRRSREREEKQNLKTLYILTHYRAHLVTEVDISYQIIT